MGLFPPQVQAKKILQARERIIKALGKTDNSNSRGRSNPRRKKGWRSKYAKRDKAWKPGASREILLI